MSLRINTKLQCYELSPSGMEVVAVIGATNDFAVYEAAKKSHTSIDEIAMHGLKLSEQNGRALFPELAAYKYRD